MRKVSCCFLFLLQLNFLSANSWADRTFASMSLSEKIGQIFMIDVRPNIEEEKARLEEYFSIDVPYDTAKDYIKHVSDMIKKHHIGGLIFMRSDVATQVKLANDFQTKSQLPLLYAMDAEWGPAMRLVDVKPFPFQEALGKLEEKDEKKIYEMGKVIGKQCRQLGIHINFAPVVDINNNPKNLIIKHRSFGADKENVTRKASQYMSGLHDANVMAVAKHFPGHGNVTIDTHKEAGILPFTREQLHETELYPYKQLISRGLRGIMTTHLVVTALDKEHPATLSAPVITDLLRKELGFDGLVFADCMMMKAISQDYSPGDAAVRAFKAGVDVILMPVDLPKSIQAIEKAIENEPELEEKLDKSVMRILRAKEKFGLHENKLVDQTVTAKDINSKAALALIEDLPAHAR